MNKSNRPAPVFLPGGRDEDRTGSFVLQILKKKKRGGQMEIEKFDVIGMTCAACEANVTKAVSRLDGVQKAEVSLLSNSMKVEFDPEKTDPSRIEEAVAKIGYEAVLQNQKLNEMQKGSIADEWEERQKKVKAEMDHRRMILVTSLILLAVLMCFSMLPMMGIFTFFMDMEWMMVSTIIQLVLSMFILFIQRDFFIHGFKALFRKAPNMDSLVAMGSSVSFLYGLYGILRMAYGYGLMDHEIIHSSMDALYFESAAMIVTLVSLGKYLEARSKAKTSDALGKLADLTPKSAVIEKDGVEIQVEASQVTSGDLVVVRPGQKIPVDGIVQSGTGYVDQAAITGESVPVEKQAGDEVMAATINVNGSFKFTATRVGDDTTLAQVIRLVNEAGNSKAPIARLADQVSGIFVPAVLILSALTFIGWMIAGFGFEFALSNAVSVMVISCPCALGLATPLAIMVSTGKAAEYGVLIKSAEALETLHKVKTIVFDKTGTITQGKPEVVAIEVFEPGLSQKQFLEMAARAEMGSEHPLGKAVTARALEENMVLSAPDSFEAVSGRGLQASVNGTVILAGNRAFMNENNIEVSDREQQALDACAARGQTPMLFAFNGRLAGLIAIADTVRPDSAAALAELRRMGIETVMLTGDNARTAKAIASDLAIDRVISDVLPADKESVIRQLQEEGKITAMVGDGINDAPALTRADVGIAIGAGTDIAIESADVVLMKDSLLDVVAAVQLSKATIRNIKENLFWAFFYNVCGIPVAMGLFYPAFGWLLNPMIGAAAMAFSSVTVCLNALRLRFFRPTVRSVSEKQIPTESRAAIQKEEEKIEDLPEILEKQAEKEAQESLILKVSGMTCAHCQKRVKDTLESDPEVRTAEVSLENKEAFVLLNPGVKKTKQLAGKLARAVSEAGYPASVLDEESQSDSETPSEKSNPDEQAGQNTAIETIQLGGMSCAHCTARVTQALESVDGVVHASVQLDPQMAEVTVLPKTPAADPENLIRAVKEAGYEASVTAEPEENEIKTVITTLDLSGLSCEHCVKRTQSALEKVDGVLEASVSLDPMQATVKAQAGTSGADPENLILAVRNAGYDASLPEAADNQK